VSGNNVDWDRGEALSLSFLLTANASVCFYSRNFLNRKDQKKVTKLEAQIPYHEGRGNKDEVVKIKEQIADIWEKAKMAAAME
jgi:hypothetical protein